MGKLTKLPPLKDRAYQTIKDMILSGRYREGELLSLGDLSKDLGISKTPLREALLRLEQDRLVTTVPYRGTYVKTITSREIEEVFQVRSVLEPLAAKLATPSIPKGELTTFQEMFDSIGEQVARGQFDLYLESDIGFHDLIVQNCGNKTLQDLLGLLADRVYRIRMFSKASWGDHIAQSHREHCGILAALMRRDACAAERLMAEHVSNAGTRIGSLLVREE